MVDSRPRGRGFEPHRRHCVVSLSKNINPSLVLVQPRKTHPIITERLLMGRKESNKQTRTNIGVRTGKTQFTLNKYRIPIHFWLYWYTNLLMSSSQFPSKSCKKISIIGFEVGSKIDENRCKGLVTFRINLNFIQMLDINVHCLYMYKKSD